MNVDGLICLTGGLLAALTCNMQAPQHSRVKQE